MKVYIVEEIYDDFITYSSKTVGVFKNKQAAEKVANKVYDKGKYYFAHIKKFKLNLASNAE